MKVEERYKVWQEMLARPQGVTYKQMEHLLEKHFKDECYVGLPNETLRQDKKSIGLLLKNNGYTLVEEKNGKTSIFRTDTYVDIVKLHLQSKVARPYLAILDMLSHCRGFMPDSFLKSLSSVYADLSNSSVAEQNISFEANYDNMPDKLDIFAVIYHALNNYPLRLSYHKVNNPGTICSILFYPEYLKQYRSNWYAFGVIRDEDNPDDSNLKTQRISLNVIDDYLEVTDLPFIHSEVSDYSEYFKEIVGVENDPNVSAEIITFRISNRMFNRLINNRFHETIKPYSALDAKGFKGMSVCVKCNKELIRIFLNYGSDIEVVSPNHIKKKLVDEYKRCLKRYQ